MMVEYSPSGQGKRQNKAHIAEERLSRPLRLSIYARHERHRHPISQAQALGRALLQPIRDDRIDLRDLRERADPQRVEAYLHFGRELSAKKAIQWATTEGNTTKLNAPGGIGLAILKEFVVQNRGALQIVSNDGFYELNEAGESLGDFAGEFPGTIVTMIINTNDRFSYGIADAGIKDGIF